MRGIKLYRLLAPFTKQELKELYKAVKSPLFNTNPTVVKLFERLRYYHPNFDETPRGRRKLYERLFPNEDFNDLKFRRLFTFLSQIIENYLLFKEMENRPLERQQMLIDIHGKRKDQVLFELETERLKEQLDAVKIRNAEWFYKQYQLLSSHYASIYFDKYNHKDDTLEQSIEYLDQFFGLAKAFLNISLENKHKIFKEIRENHFLPLPDSDQMYEVPLFNLYQMAKDLLQNPSHQKFLEYERLFQSEFANLERNDQLLLFFNGLNYVTRRVNNGETELKPNTFEWYKWGLETEALLANKQISPVTFSNIVLLGCELKSFNWINDFIRDYESYLPKGIRVEEVAYSKAMLYFAQGEFDEVLSFLCQPIFSIKYTLKIKNLTVRTYFEMYKRNINYFDLVHSSLKNYENFLYRNKKLKDVAMRAHFNFVQIMKSLMTKVFRLNTEEEVGEWLKEQIGSRSEVVSTNWLKHQTGSTTEIFF